MEGDGDGHTGSEGVRRGGGEGVRVRGDEVEVMVREVIREKVAEALMKQTHSTEERLIGIGQVMTYVLHKRTLASSPGFAQLLRMTFDPTEKCHT